MTLDTFPAAVRTASKLTTFWGVLVGLSAVALAFPLIFRAIPVTLPAVAFCAALLAFSVTFFIYGRRLRTPSRRAAIVVIGLFIASSGLSLTFRFAAAPIGALLGIIVVGILLTNWEQIT